MLEYHLPSEWYQRIAEQKREGAEAAAEAAAMAAAPGGPPAQAPDQLLPVAQSYREIARFQAVPSVQNYQLQARGPAGGEGGCGQSGWGG